MSIIKLADVALTGKRVLVREDLNVPLKDGEITSDARIRAALPTLRHCMEAGARVMVMSHLGRPREGEYDPALSLAPVAERLTELLGVRVPLARDWLDGVDVEEGAMALCENVRFNKGEKKDDEQLSHRLASLCDVYVMDAFATAHRAQASTHGVARFAPIACAGPLLSKELEALGNALEDPKRPLVAIVGGAKVSSKVGVLEALSQKVDKLILGGGIANTFMAAAGYSIGKSLYEPDLVVEAGRLADAIRSHGGDIPLPSDVVVAHTLSESAEADVRQADNVDAGQMILDVGPDSAERIAAIVRDAGTVVWNGPLGVFEYDQFGEGTRTLARAIAESSAFSIAGGGDTLAALDKYGVTDRISYVSTGGGAFLEFLEDKTLLAVAVLEMRGAEDA